MAFHRRELPLKVEGFPAGTLGVIWDDETDTLILDRPEITILTENLRLAVESYYGPLQRDEHGPE